MNNEFVLSVDPDPLGIAVNFLYQVYRKRYGLDWFFAIKELKLLGIVLDPIYVRKLGKTIEEQIKFNHRRKLIDKSFYNSRFVNIRKKP